MHVLTLKYKGYALNLEFVKKGYYCTKEFEPGKTIYQILFEHLIDKKLVEPGKIVKKYAGTIKNYGFSSNTINHFVTMIQNASKKSPNKLLQSMRFVRVSHGGAHPVVNRISPKSRYSRQQSEIMSRVTEEFLRSGKPINIAEIKAAYFAALESASLHTNVKLTDTYVRRRVSQKLNLQPIASGVHGMPFNSIPRKRRQFR